MSESELYKELGILTKDRGKWEENIPYVSSLLNHDSVKIKAKALWLLGEMGLAFPLSVKKSVPAIASFLDSPAPLLRERAVNALGRIGRGGYSVIEPHWASLFRFVSDEDAKVRLSFLWASENIATNTPDIYEDHMPLFERLLHDEDDKVRMEAPEIFRVIGKRRPAFVQPYVKQLQQISETDDNRVVRIHCLGAIKATASEQTNRKFVVVEAHMNCPYCNDEMEEGTFCSRGSNYFLPKGSKVTWLSKKNIQNANAVMLPPDPLGVNHERPLAYCCRNCKKIVIAYKGDNGIYS